MDRHSKYSTFLLIGGLSVSLIVAIFFLWKVGHPSYLPKNSRLHREEERAHPSHMSVIFQHQSIILSHGTTPTITQAFSFFQQDFNSPTIEKEPPQKLRKFSISSLDEVTPFQV